MRRPKPFYRSQTRSWYVQLGKQQIPLGKDEKQAWMQYHALMAGNQDPRPEMPVAMLLDEFLEWSSKNQAEATYEWYKQYQ